MFLPENINYVEFETLWPLLIVGQQQYSQTQKSTVLYMYIDTSDAR